MALESVCLGLQVAFSLIEYVFALFAWEAINNFFFFFVIFIEIFFVFRTLVKVKLLLPAGSKLMLFSHYWAVLFGIRLRESGLYLAYFPLSSPLSRINVRQEMLSIWHFGVQINSNSIRLGHCHWRKYWILLLFEASGYLEVPVLLEVYSQLVLFVLRRIQAWQLLSFDLLLVSKVHNDRHFTASRTINEFRLNIRWCAR